MAIDPANAGAVGAALLQYLRGKLSVPALAYAEPPSALGDGWETYIYVFRLAGHAADEVWAAPLVLRIFPTLDLGARAEQEVAVQTFVAARGFPAPRPLAVEPAGDVLGLPFMIMGRAPGTTLFEHMSANPLRARRLIPKMAEAHAALHRLPTAGCPLPSDSPLVQRKREGFRARIERFGLTGLDREYAWLDANTKAVANEEVSVCHTDFHPQNIVVDGDGRLCVIDWSAAALGDRHDDLAATLVIMRTAPAPAGNFWSRLLDRFGRGLFIRRYLRSYRRLLPIDGARLRYWEALEAFEDMLRISALKVAGAAGYGIRADAAERLPPAQLETLRRYFWDRAKEEK